MNGNPLRRRLVSSCRGLAITDRCGTQPSMALVILPKPVQKRFALHLSKRRPHPAVAACHDVENRIWIFKPRLMSHARFKPSAWQPSMKIACSNDGPYPME